MMISTLFHRENHQVSHKTGTAVNHKDNLFAYLFGFMFLIGLKMMDPFAPSPSQSFKVSKFLPDRREDFYPTDEPTLLGQVFQKRKTKPCSSRGEERGGGDAALQRAG